MHDGASETTIGEHGGGHGEREKRRVNGNNIEIKNKKNMATGKKRDVGW